MRSLLTVSYNQSISDIIFARLNADVKWIFIEQLMIDRNRVSHRTGVVFLVYSTHEKHSSSFMNDGFRRNELGNT